MPALMKNVLFGIIAVTTISARPAAAVNAYDAMRVVGTEKGAATLEAITEVRGLHGSPQPGMWKITTKVASYEVRAGKVAATSIGRVLPTLSLSDLKLDSDGAHTVAEREAKKAAFAYDFVDYTLRTGAKSTPVWEVRLVDEASHATAVLNIGADTGKIISAEGLKNAKPPIVAQPPRPSTPRYVEQDPADYPPTEPSRQKERSQQLPPEREARGEDSAPHYNQGYEKTIDRVADHLKLRGRQFSSWFERNVRPGGRPTYGTSGTVRTEREERRQPEPSRDPNATRYYRPEPGERLRD